jgi:hypothetical protein
MIPKRNGSSKVELTAPSAVVLVEGIDDVHVIQALAELTMDCDHEHLFILPAGGKSEIRSAVTGLASVGSVAKMAGFNEFGRILAIIRDADTDRGGAEQSVRDALRSAGLPVPEQQMQVKAKQGKCSTAFLVIPPDQDGGCIETVLAAAAEQSSYQCAQEFLRCMHADNNSGNLHDKQLVHSIIAASAQPGMRLGESLRAGLWNADSSALNKIKQFLQLISKELRGR